MSTEHLNLASVIAEVTDAFYRYESALRDGDTETLGELFWKSNATIRYGMGGEIGYGWDAIQSHRRAAKPLVGAWRTLSDIVVNSFGQDMAIVSALFHQRAQPNMVGRQMQTWCRIDGRWVIVAAHVSWVERQ